MMMLNKFHNCVKSYLLDHYLPPKAKIISFTLGSDESPELWLHSQPQFFLGIDSNRARVVMAKRKIPHESIHYLHENSKELLFEKLELQKMKFSFDLATIFFDLEYFFEKKNYFKNIMTNANEALKIGGHFILTGFNGERINEVMTRIRLIRGKSQGRVLWTIEGNYENDFILNKPNFDQSIKLSMWNYPGFKKKMLVNMDYIIHTAPLYGFELVEATPFECYYREIKHGTMLNRAEQELSFFNDCLVFRKIK